MVNEKAGHIVRFRLELLPEKSDTCRLGDSVIGHGIGGGCTNVSAEAAFFSSRLVAHRTIIADYAASKAALINLHESLRYELDKRYVKIPFLLLNLILFATGIRRLKSALLFSFQDIL